VVAPLGRRPWYQCGSAGSIRLGVSDLTPLVGCVVEASNPFRPDEPSLVSGVGRAPALNEDRAAQAEPCRPKPDGAHDRKPGVRCAGIGAEAAMVINAWVRHPSAVKGSTASEATAPTLQRSRWR
jgi:hypothetical protein